MSRSLTPPHGRTSAESAVHALMALGFSQYEASTYAGLVGQEPMTGYAVAKRTQVPQPKVYETLRRLAERGAVIQVDEDPARFVAVAPERLLSTLESAYKRALVDAELEISQLQSVDDAVPIRILKEARSWATTVANAQSMMATATRRIYLSGFGDHLKALTQSIVDADDRGVRIDVLSFGEPPISALRHGEVVRHRSTDHIVFPHHQARHLALTCDSASSLWALAPDGSDWECAYADGDELLCALVKDFVRHDLFVNRVYNDFGPEMHRQYGGGLEGLFGAARPAAAAHDVARPTTRFGSGPSSQVAAEG
jgi:sugar-specific transcriptional regulator TrmB